jgi:hypothetical protein
MSRTAVYIRDNPNATGDCDWIDVTNNWRDADATWLQERSIVRVTTTPDAEIDVVNTHEGRVFYSTNDKVLYLSTTGSAPFDRIMSSEFLVVDESVSGSSQVGISGHEAYGIAFDTSSGFVTIGNLTVSTLGGVGLLNVNTVDAGTVSVGSGGLTIETDGSHSVVMTTGADGLLLSTGLDVAGPVSAPTGDFGFLSAVGPTSLATTTIASTLTVGTSTITPTVTSPSSGDLTIQIQPGRSIRFTGAVADTNLYFGSNINVRVAWVVVGAIDPGVGNVPEGTIWIQP